VDVTVEFYKNSVSTRAISFLNYLRTIIQANYLVSALNTNILVSIRIESDQYRVGEWHVDYAFDIFNDPTNIVYVTCIKENPIKAVGFVSISNDSSSLPRWTLKSPVPNSTKVNGFYGGCTPLESLLQSTFDCLYDIKCLQLLLNYFPYLKQVCKTLSQLSYIFFFPRCL
jgi:hypothetical protein